MKYKKLLITISLVIASLILLLFSFGIQIGNVRIGKQADLLTIQDPKFSKSNFFESYYSDDKLIVFNTWATWCVPCINEMPALNKIKSTFASSDVHFLSLSVDKDSLRLADFNKKGMFKYTDITFENLEYRNAILNVLNGRKPDEWISTTVVPQTFVLKDKKVIETFNGEINEKELTSIIEKYK